MDLLNEDEEMDLIRALEHSRQSQQQKKLREKHANAQAKYRRRLVQKMAPTRTDFSVVVLATALRAINAAPEQKLVRRFREAIEAELLAANFDQDQIRIRLGRMLEDCDKDLKNWRRAREWRREHATRVARAMEHDGKDD